MTQFGGGARFRYAERGGVGNDGGVADGGDDEVDGSVEVEGLLRGLGVDPADLLGFGGEARVWALGTDRVVRVCHPGTPRRAVEQRIDLLTELMADAAPSFALPDVVEVRELAGRLLTVERRLAGVTVAAALGSATGDARRRLVEAHLGAAAALAALPLRPRPWFGQLIGDDPVRSPTWPGFLERRAAASLALSGIGDGSWAADVAARLTAELLGAAPSGDDERCFVHLDAFAGNMMAAAGQVTAVLDFGPTCLAGGATWFDPVACAVYLGAPEITPTAQAEDVAMARAWLRDRGLDALHDPLRHWLAAFWSFAVDDPKLHGWCRSVLAPEPGA